jgi:hypothetical protein
MVGGVMLTLHLTGINDRSPATADEGPIVSS